MNIRKATYKDIPTIHHLVRELAIYEKAEKEFIATLEDYQKNWKAGVFEVLVAEIEETVVGMALYYLTYSTWKGKMLYLEDFVVETPYRKQGVGQLLFDGFLAEAKAKGCTMVKWQVLDWNKPAIDFYIKNNATIEEQWWTGKIIF